MNDESESRDVCLSLRAFGSLATSAARDPEGLGIALREAGRVQGGELGARVLGRGQRDELSLGSFWREVNALTGVSGLGSFRYARIGEAVAEVRATSLPDGAPPGGVSETNAPFTEGLLEGLLSEAAGEPVGSLTVAGGDKHPRATQEWRFLVGSPPYLRSIRLRVASGSSLEALLEEA